MDNVLELSIEGAATDSLADSLDLMIPDLDVAHVTARLAERIQGVLNRGVGQEELKASDFDEVIFFLAGKKIELPEEMNQRIARFMKKDYGNPNLNCHDFVFQATGHPRTTNIMDHGQADEISLKRPLRLSSGTPILFVPRLPGIKTNSLRHSAIYLTDQYCIQKHGQSPGLWIAKIEDVAKWQGRVTGSTLPSRVYRIRFKGRPR